MSPPPRGRRIEERPPFRPGPGIPLGQERADARFATHHGEPAVRPTAGQARAHSGRAAARGLIDMDSRHEGGADVLGSPADLYVALGVRLRERPAARWMVEMHPRTRADFDLEAFTDRFDALDIRIYASRYVAPGEYRLSQRGFGAGSDTGPDEDDYWPASGG